MRSRHHYVSEVESQAWRVHVFLKEYDYDPEVRPS